MLTLEILYAVLQGLEPKYLSHLDTPWAVFCMRIHAALQKGEAPLSAFKTALGNTSPREIGAISRMLREAYPVMKLPGLWRRQKEALVVLRYWKVASLSQLSQALAMDRSNTFRTLRGLVVKGFAFKFIRNDGVYYYAIPAPLDHSVKSEINRLLLAQISDPMPFHAGKLTTMTTPTTLTMPTMFQKATTVTTSQQT